MKKSIFLFICAFILVACGPGQMFGPTPTPRPTATPLPAIGEAWISGFENCPTHPEYGQLIVDSVNVYQSVDMLPEGLQRVPHGAKVEILRRVPDEGMVLIRRGTSIEGYVQEIFVVDYDPDEGVQPDETYCIP